MLVFYLVLLPMALSTSCPAYSFSSGATCMPCGVRCSTCTTNTLCTACSNGYYLGTGDTCLSCPSNCRTCSSGSICSVCVDPFVLNSGTGRCEICSIQNAIACSSLTNATKCNSTYYSEWTYCGSCVLHCKTCTNSTICQECLDGYLLQYQNSVCSGCTNCKSCTGTLDNCTACWDGFKLVQSGTTYICGATICDIPNCSYCSADSVCGNCKSGYYLSLNACLLGASLVCSAGAVGTKPNQCAIGCWAGGQPVGNTTNGSLSQFACQPSDTLQRNSVSQLYLYMYNDYLFAWSSNVVTLSTGCLDQGYVISPPPLQFQLSPYYKVIIQLKLYSLLISSMTVMLTSGSQQQNSTVRLEGSCTYTYATINSVTVSSDNLTISFMEATLGSFGLIEILMTVEKCSSDCLQCLNPDICLVCSPPLYSYNYKCISDCMGLYQLNQSGYLSCVLCNNFAYLVCPDGFYNDPSTSTLACQACPSQCLTCSNSTTCFSCQSVNSIQYYYLSSNNTCVSSCPDFYFPRSSVCLNCLAPCKKCLNETTCLSCLLGYWNGSECVNQCPAATYSDESTHACLACSPLCLTCYWTSTYCKSCSLPLILFQNTCLTHCRDGYYQDAYSCIRCIPPCNTCDNASSCSSCSFGYLYNRTCSNSCPTGWYPDLGSFECRVCNNSCTKCSEAGYCTECPIGYCLSNGNCNSISRVGGACIATYFPLFVQNVCICTSCLYPCLTCSNEQNCLSCVSGYLSDSRCASGCPTGFFGNDTSQKCETCSSSYSNCQVCTTSNCTICMLGFFLNQFESVSSAVCTSICPPKMYADSSFCQWCVSPCSTCTDQVGCLSCVAGYFLKGSSCVIQCSSGEYPNTLPNGTSICTGCITPCSTCTDASNCLSCIRVASANSIQFYYNGTNCAQACPSTYYPDHITLRCEKCLTPCNTCSSQSVCLSCALGFLNPSTSKCEQCSSGTYPDNASLSCLPCQLNCDMCLDASSCSHCTNSTYLFNGSCISAIQCANKSGYYLSESLATCAKCLSPCSTCLNETVCQTCLNGYMYYSTTCIVMCPDGYYGSSNNYSCLKCSPECLTCVENSTICLTCSNGYLYSRSTRKCLVSCPSKTYQSGGLCVDCKYPCLECTSEVSCSSCQNGIFESVSRRCISVCPSQQYPSVISSSLMCLNCSSVCAECTGSPVNCAQCPNNTYLINNTCLAVCPDTYFADSQVGICFGCISPCLSCSDEVTCTRCSDSYLFAAASGQCLSVCPDGYYNVTNPNVGQSKYVCSTCLPECLTCNSATSCLMCKNGVQMNGQCLSMCPPHMFAQAGTCFNCTLPCLQCITATICSSCPPVDGYLLVAGSSCIVSTTCPQGFYLVPNSSNCSTVCGVGFYKDSATRTCGSNCPGDQFKTSDGSCSESCLPGYYGNSTYYCVKCATSSSSSTGYICPDTLSFNLSSEIVGDSLLMSINFTLSLLLTRSIENSDIMLVPDIAFELKSHDSQSVVLELKPGASIKYTFLLVRILNPFSLFQAQRPLQNPVQSIILEGLDIYDASATPELSVFGTTVSTVVAVTCLFRGYFGLDFLQNMFLLSLVSVHYPNHLNSFIQAFRASNLWFPVADFDAPASYKFKTVVKNMSLLGNTLYIFIVFGVYALFMATMSLARYIIGKIQSEKHSQSPDVERPLCQQRLETVIEYSSTQLPLRLLYIFYCFLSVFTMCQLYNMPEQQSNFSSLASRYLSVPLAVVLVVVPIVLLHKTTQYKLAGMLLVRKLIISISVVAAIQYPVYIIGLIMVANMCTLIILPTQRPIEWKVELILCCVGETLQVVILAMFAAILLAGEGYFTTGKVLVGSTAIFLIVAVCLLYAVLNILMIALSIFKIRGRDYISEWSNQVADDSNKSSSENDIVSDVKLANQIERSHPNILAEPEDKVTLEDNGMERPVFAQTKAFDGRNYETFRVYPQEDSEAEENPVPAPPDVLVRVVTKFDDFDTVV